MLKENINFLSDMNSAEKLVLLNRDMRKGFIYGINSNLG